jgi:potassium efflux system protein
VAEANPHVMRDPPPQAVFVGFGDASLAFELRVFSPDAAHLLPIRHELHLAIEKAFRQAGIEIASLKRDLQLRSVPRT